ncbi:hypothetical protein D3C81_815750 [compost metagenome]
MVLDHSLFGVAKPVTDNLDVGRRQFEAASAQGAGVLCGLEHHGALGNLVGQPATLQQRLQGLLRRQGTGHRRGLLASDKLRTEEQLQRSLLTQLAQGRRQGLSLDLNGSGCLIGVASGDATTDGQGQGQRQQTKAGGRTRGKLIVVHVVEKS